MVEVKLKPLEDFITYDLKEYFRLVSKSKVMA